MKITYSILALLLLPILSLLGEDRRRISDALVIKGIELYQKSDFPAALDVLSKAEALDPSNDAVQYYLGYLDIVANNASGALTHFRNAYRMDSTNYWYSLRLASLYAAVGKPVQASDMFERLLRDKPYDINLLSSLADVYVRLNKLDQADSLLARIERINGPSQYSTLTKLDLLRFRGRFDEFFQGLKTFFEDNQVPSSAKVDMVEKMLKSADPRFNYVHLADYDSLVQTCLNVHPADTCVLHFAAGFHFSAENYDRCLELCRMADADDGQMTSMELYIYLKREDYESALECCDRILEYSGNDNGSKVMAYTTKGDCYGNMGRGEAAYREYEKALKLAPDDIVTLNNYAYFMSCQGKNLGKCMEMARKVLEVEGENPTYLDTYGWILYKRKKYAEAKTVFKKAMLYGGKDNPDILEHYAATLQALGETALADGYRRQAQIKRENASKK